MMMTMASSQKVAPVLFSSASSYSFSSFCLCIFISISISSFLSFSSPFPTGAAVPGAMASDLATSCSRLKEAGIVPDVIPTEDECAHLSVSVSQRETRRERANTA